MSMGAEQGTPFARGTVFLKRPNSTARLAELLGKRLEHAWRLSPCSFLNSASASATETTIRELSWACPDQRRRKGRRRERAGRSQLARG